ncbi:hypothetical protein CR513_33592, partial [Mucuna pruriens]
MDLLEHSENFCKCSICFIFITLQFSKGFAIETKLPTTRSKIMKWADKWPQLGHHMHMLQFEEATFGDIYRFIVLNKQLQVLHIPGTDQLGDLLTKPLSPSSYAKTVLCSSNNYSKLIPQDNHLKQFIPYNTGDSAREQSNAGNTRKVLQNVRNGWRQHQSNGTGFRDRRAHDCFRIGFQLRTPNKGSEIPKLSPKINLKGRSIVEVNRASLSGNESGEFAFSATSRYEMKSSLLDE